MIIKKLTAVLLLLTFSFPSFSQAEQQEKKPLPKATKSQISDWIAQHAVAWDEGTKLEISSDDCRLQINRDNTNSIMNFSGILFPVEIIAKQNSKHPYVRVRFKDRYSGDYGMKKACNAQNDFCKKNVGKWSPISYFDFKVTDVVNYIGMDRDLNHSKSRSLARALTHYARLCNATDYEFTF
jgi:hypothetical protein